MSRGRAHMKISSGGNYKNDYILNRKIVIQLAMLLVK